jgi:enamine deaminase RidA (YjgF/YER057c/UK114 family)
VLRRFAGPIADELFLLTTPADPAASASSQCESAYEALREALAVDRVSPEALTSETVFVSRIEEDAAAVVAARRRAFEPLASAASRSVTTLIGQPPLDESHRLAIAAAATVPHGRSAVETSDVRRPLTCSCGTCRGGARGRLFRIGDEKHFRAANVHGVGDSAFAQAYDMFEVAEQVLAAAGMTFRDVQRTWIYLRDIDRDYDALNQARRQFFLDSRLERRPASTGVQGIPVSAAHDFAVSLYAVTSSQPLDVTRMSTPTLNEAWTYGAEFSRGLRVVDANKVTLHISGTASIDEGGRTVHVGDLPAQVERMLRNIETLLSAQGATFGDVVSAVAYVKHPADAPAVRSLLDARGFTGFPCALVEAPLCRRELLCEIEAVALLPLALAPKTR